MPRLEDCHAIVLAAGKGTRMGGPKALMEVAGRPWWQHQHERLSRLGLGRVTWVVSPVVRAAIAQSGGGDLSLILADPEAPMFASVLAGLEAASIGRLQGTFILPVDCPAPSSAVWQELGAADSAAVPTHQGQRGHPLFLPGVSMAGVLDAAASCRVAGRDPGRTLRLDHLVGHEVRECPTDDPAVTTNLNTPRDLAHWIPH